MKIQNSFLKRAQIPYDYYTGLQIRDFWRAFHKNHLNEATFKYTDMKQMKCYQRDLASKPLSNYYKIFKIFTFEIYKTR